LFRSCLKDQYDARDSHPPASRNTRQATRRGQAARYAIGRPLAGFSATPTACPSAENIGVPEHAVSQRKALMGGCHFFIEHPKSRARWRSSFAKPVLFLTKSRYNPAWQKEPGCSPAVSRACPLSKPAGPAVSFRRSGTAHTIRASFPRLTDTEVPTVVPIERARRDRRQARSSL
jgi:hypothetical protein